MQRVSPLIQALCAGALLSCSAVATASVTVEFDTPDHYTDVRGHEGRLQMDIFDPLSEYLGTLSHRLPEGEDLKIEIVDIDLAGEMLPSGPYHEPMRVLRASTWPRIKLKYQLENASGEDLRSGEATLSDMDYLNTSGTLSSTDPLRYEKRLLRDWIDREFVSPTN